ncbi:MAG: hypothetical protein ACE5NP_04185 [Anaerolineae bacterium]
MINSLPAIFTSATPLLLGLLVTGAIIVAVRDWRASLLALSGQYVLVGFLLMGAIPAYVAMVKIIVGGLACPILYLGARQTEGLRRERVSTARLSSPKSEASTVSVSTELDEVSAERQAQRSSPERKPSLARTRRFSFVAFFFRISALVLMAVLAYFAFLRYPLEGLSSQLNLGSYWLALVGLLTLILTDQPFYAGLGLLTFLSGFELSYSLYQPSLSLAGLLGGLHLLTALLVAHLCRPQVSTGTGSASR